MLLAVGAVAPVRPLPESPVQPLVLGRSQAHRGLDFPVEGSGGHRRVWIPQSGLRLLAHMNSEAPSSRQPLGEYEDHRRAAAPCHLREQGHGLGGHPEKGANTPLARGS